MEPTEVVTTVEPTIVESTPSEAQIVEQSTPMDSNVTYNNISEPTFNPGMEPVQNLINDAVTIERDMNVANNAGKAMNNFLTNKYDYNKNEAGTYWVAGAINDTNTQMSFLQTLINEEMYDEMDLQKYYYDTNLATARAYAAQKSMETAYGFYRAAQEKALAEASLTGWYMPAEGQYLLGQYTVAQRTLEDPDATPEQLAKADRVLKTTEEWFAANQITTRGIKCLSMLQFEETVRNNTVMAELENEANQIAANQNAAASAMAALNLREFKFSVEEAELLAGRDYSSAIGLDDNKGYIGHHSDDYDLDLNLDGYENTSTMLIDSPYWYNAVLTARGRTYVDNILKSAGYDAQGYYDYYNDQKLFDTIITEELKDYKEGSTADDLTYLSREIPTDKMHKLDITTTNGREMYTFAGRVYVKDRYGVMQQVVSNIEVKKDGEISNVANEVVNFTTDTLSYKGKNWYAGDVRQSQVVEYNPDGITFASDTQKEKVIDLQREGYVLIQGARSNKGINADIVMMDKDGNYYEVSNVYGDVKEIDEDNIFYGPAWYESGSTATEVTVDHIGENKNKIYDAETDTAIIVDVNKIIKDTTEKINTGLDKTKEAATGLFDTFNKNADNTGETTGNSTEEIVNNPINQNKNTTEESKKEWEKVVEQAKEAAEKVVEQAKESTSKTTTPAPELVGKGKTIDDVQTELGKIPTKTFGEIFEKYDVPKERQQELLKIYHTPKALEQFLSTQYNGFLGQDYNKEQEDKNGK